MKPVMKWALLQMQVNNSTNNEKYIIITHDNYYYWFTGPIK